MKDNDSNDNWDELEQRVYENNSWDISDEEIASLDGLEDDVLEDMNFGDLPDGLRKLTSRFFSRGASFKDELVEIPEMTEEKAETLIESGYDSAEAIHRADLDEIYALDGIGVQHAVAVQAHVEQKLEEFGVEESDAEETETAELTAEEAVENKVVRNDPTDSESERDEEPTSRHQSDALLSDEQLEQIKTAATRVGRGLASIPVAIGVFFVAVLVAVAGTIASKLPKRDAIYRKMIVAGYENLQKNTGAHVVCNSIYGDGTVIPRKAELDKEKGHLKTDNGEWWTATSGLNPVFFGDAKVVTGVVDHHELVDPVAARIAEAVDLGPQRQQEVVETPDGFVPALAKGGSSAVADGGYSNVPSSFDDVWLDVSNPDPDNDGMIVSLEKAYEMHWDQGSSEEMENQETRGMLAVMDPRGSTKQAILYVLLFAGGIGLGMFGPGLAAQLAGGAGNGGGAGISIMIMLGAGLI